MSVKLDPPVERSEEIDRNPDIDDSLFALEDPVAILSAFHRMRARRDRASIAFDHADLHTLSKAWERAAIAGCGDLEFLREKERYAHLRDHVRNGMAERKTDRALTWFESKDWPRKHLIERAIERLQYAQIKSIH